MPSVSRTPLASLVLAVAALAALWVAPAASAQPTSKPYRVAITPPVPLGVTNFPVEVKVTNDADPQSIGSLKITVPAGVTLAGAGPAQGVQPQKTGTAATWLNQSIAPGKDQSYVMYVTVPCSGDFTNARWLVEPKQSNNFSGPPGNTFGPQTPDPLSFTPAPGGCSISWAAQPKNAEDAPKTISSLAFTPVSPTVAGPSVRISNGQGNVPVTVTRSFTTGGLGTLQGTTTVRTNSSGVAEFRDLSIDRPGYYRLVASAPGSDPVVSDSVLIQSVVSACTGVGTCTADASESQNSVRVTLDESRAGDKLSASLLREVDVANEPNCAQYYTSISRTFSLVLGTGSNKTIVYQISKDDMRTVPDNGAPHIEVCYSDFAPAGASMENWQKGTPIDTPPMAPFWAPDSVMAGTKPIAADLDGDTMVDGADWVLARCDANGGRRPCTLRTYKTGAGVGVAEVLAPGGLLDPRTSP